MSEEKKKPELPTAPTYDSTSWWETDAGKAALDSYNNAKDSVNNYGDFSFSNGSWLNSVKDSIRNYGNFSYDFNADALYQQYKDKYIQQGRMAMADTIGQASAMTGGYGNSYATTAGSQAYQAHLQNLNDVIPELYQLALDRYNMGKEDLYNQYSLLSNEYNREYGEYSDKYDRLTDTLGIAKSDYYDGGTLYNSDQSNKNDVAGQTFNDAMALYEAEENARRYEESKSVVANDGDPVVPPAKNYDNGTLTTAQVKELQTALGVEADGYFGEQSKEAAGGRGAMEAWEAYQNGEFFKQANLMDFDRGDYSKNVEANGGSYYSSTLNDLKGFKNAGKSNKFVQSYLAELVANSIITGSEYATLYNKYRDNKLN